jgi:peroxiredoxin
MSHVTRRAALGLAAGTLTIGRLLGKSAAQETPRPFAEALVSKDVEAVPAFSFVDASGATKTLADYAGKPVVLNLWATWCIPCISEMPDLNRLSVLMQGKMWVLPLSSDHGGTPVVEAWYTAHGIDHLPVLLDPKGAAMHTLAARGIPTTYLIGVDGKLHAKLEGAVAWTAPASVQHLDQLMS